ncbi:MAG TPA: gliding motility-associated C-terminal domain-containing protein [Elusimicrobiota bacterium]|nr:gliding motility-associated C-terminal domain-containing protein [Elusimicrobiota bacterium]
MMLSKLVSYIKSNSAFLALVISLSLNAAAVSALHVQSRIFTPNNDGWNDVVIFTFDNPALLPIKGEIYDIAGMKVEDMRQWNVADESLAWDGKHEGQIVSSGVYFYKIEIGNRVYTGTVVVAK